MSEMNTITFWSTDQDPYKDNGKTLMVTDSVSEDRVQALFDQRPFSDKTETVDVKVHTITVVASCWGKGSKPLNDQTIVHDYAMTGDIFIGVEGNWFKVEEIVLHDSK